MIPGDKTDWEGFFRNDLVPQVLDCVAEAWRRVPKPGSSDHEIDISLKLYRELLHVKNRNRLPFRFGYEVVEIDLAALDVSGRKDIVVFPRGTDREEIYLGLEAKRLNVLRPTGPAALAAEYVDEGMQRYVDGKYAGAVQHGVMLGYVLDGNVGAAIKNVASVVKRRCTDLCMAIGSSLTASSIKPRKRSVKESCHTRKTDSKDFLIHHVFLAGARAKTIKAKRGPKKRK